MSEGTALWPAVLELLSSSHSSRRKPCEPDIGPLRLRAQRPAAHHPVMCTMSQHTDPFDATAAWDRQRKHRRELRLRQQRLHPSRRSRSLQRSLQQRPLQWAPGQPNRLPGLQGLRPGLHRQPPSLPHRLQRCGTNAALANAGARDFFLVAEVCLIAQYYVAVAAHRCLLQVHHSKRCHGVARRLQGQAKRRLCCLLTS